MSPATLRHAAADVEAKMLGLQVGAINLHELASVLLEEMHERRVLLGPLPPPAGVTGTWGIDAQVALDALVRRDWLAIRAVAAAIGDETHRRGLTCFRRVPLPTAAQTQTIGLTMAREDTGLAVNLTYHRLSPYIRIVVVGEW